MLQKFKTQSVQNFGMQVASLGKNGHFDVGIKKRTYKLCYNEKDDVTIFKKFGSWWIHDEFMVNLWIKIVFNFTNYFIYLVDTIDVN